MSQINLKLPDDQLNAIKQYALRRRTPLSWLVRDNLQYLLQGGDPITPLCEDDLPATAIMALAQRGGAFDRLNDEPEIYTANDGEPV